MNSNGSAMERIDAAEVKAVAKARMRENGNYKRTALMIGLYMLLVNVPVMLMNYLSVGFIDLSKLDTGALGLLNTRLMLFQLLISLLLAPAFELSKARFMLKTMRESAGSPSDLFDGLGRGSYFVAIRSMLWRGFMMYIWTMMPISIMVNGLVMGGVMFALIGMVLLMVIMINRTLAYSQQFYLLAEKPRMGAMMSLKLSTIFMHGRAWELFKLELRMILYILPPMLPNIAAMFLPSDSPLFGIAMSLCTILLSALCLPAAEAATAEYFLRLKGIMESSAARMRAEAFGESNPFSDAQPGNGEQPGSGEQSESGSLPGGKQPAGSGDNEGDSGEVGH